VEYVALSRGALERNYMSKKALGSVNLEAFACFHRLEAWRSSHMHYCLVSSQVEALRPFTLMNQFYVSCTFFLDIVAPFEESGYYGE
jgi:hypothetical protein